MNRIRSLCKDLEVLRKNNYKELNKINIPSVDRIIDEEKSVKWNKEEAQRLYQRALSDRAELRKSQINSEKDLHDLIYQSIQTNCEVPITIQGAQKIYEYACEQSDSYGMDEVSDTIFDIINLIENIFKEDRDAKN